MDELIRTLVYLLGGAVLFAAFGTATIYPLALFLLKSPTSAQQNRTGSRKRAEQTLTSTMLTSKSSLY
jgi:hypothetical protein